MINQATKKRITIDYIQYDGANFIEIQDFTGGAAAKPGGKSDVFYIPTLKGDMEAKTGDYIIKGVKGEFYPCKPDIFEASYDLYMGEKPSAHPQSPAKNLSYSKALEILKGGAKVQRTGWNGKGMYLILFSHSVFVTVDCEEGEVPDIEKHGYSCHIGDSGNRIAHIGMVGDDNKFYPIGDCLCMKTAQDTFEVGWRPTSMDQLAEDWQVVE